MHNINKILRYGWNDFFESNFSEYKDKCYLPARIYLEHRKYYKLYTEIGELKAEKTGKLFYNSFENNLIPAVGDWVVIKVLMSERKAIIHNILPRRTKFSRKSPGIITEEQIIASNIDLVFIMSSLSEEINYKKIDRFLTLAIENNIKPVILLNKLDLCKNFNEILFDVKNRFPLYDTYAICSIKSIGLENIYKYFKGNKTAAIIGSSGVGKSTLINGLLKKNNLKVNEISTFSKKGKHTTTKRELFLLPIEGLIIDNPGMREIQLWEGFGGLKELFSDIEELTINCKFRDCKHETEPGCAVKSALLNGTLDKERFKSFKKLLNESIYFEKKHIIREKLVKNKRMKFNNYQGFRNNKIDDN